MANKIPAGPKVLFDKKLTPEHFTTGSFVGGEMRELLDLLEEKRPNLKVETGSLGSRFFKIGKHAVFSGSRVRVTDDGDIHVSYTI